MKTVQQIIAIAASYGEELTEIEAKERLEEYPVNTILYTKEGNGYSLEAQNNGEYVIEFDIVDNDQLELFFGKEIATRIINGEGVDSETPYERAHPTEPKSGQKTLSV